MKVIKFFGILLAATALSFTTVSCGSDDEDIIENFENGNQAVKVDLKKSANEIIMIVDRPSYAKEEYIALFDNNKMLTSYKVKSAYANSKLADIAMAEISKEDVKASRSGNTITVDLTEEFEGSTYDLMLSIFEQQKKGYENANAASF